MQVAVQWRLQTDAGPSGPVSAIFGINLQFSHNRHDGQIWFGIWQIALSRDNPEWQVPTFSTFSSTQKGKDLQISGKKLSRGEEIRTCSWSFLGAAHQQHPGVGGLTWQSYELSKCSSCSRAVEPVLVYSAPQGKFSVSHFTWCNVYYTWCNTVNIYAGKNQVNQYLSQCLWRKLCNVENIHIKLKIVLLSGNLGNFLE